MYVCKYVSKGVGSRRGVVWVWVRVLVGLGGLILYKKWYLLIYQYTNLPTYQLVKVGISG